MQAEDPQYVNYISKSDLTKYRVLLPIQRNNNIQ